MTKNKPLCITEFSDDIFFNIIKFLPLNETVKLKVANKKIREYLKEEKVLSLSNVLVLNNYLKIVKFIDFQKLCDFFTSILQNESNIYENPYYVRKKANYGISAKQLMCSSQNGFLKNITLKGEFLRNTSLFDISLILISHSQTLQELNIHGMNDINCPLRVYSNYSTVFDFFVKEILVKHNNPIQRISKEDLENRKKHLFYQSNKNGEYTKKHHIMCEHLYAIYDTEKECFEQIKNYKQQTFLNTYIHILQNLEILRLMGIQTFDWIEMFRFVSTPSLRILSIFCYDYFFYFYQMLLSLFAFGSGTDVFKKYLTSSYKKKINKKEKQRNSTYQQWNLNSLDIKKEVNTEEKKDPIKDIIEQYYKSKNPSQIRIQCEDLAILNYEFDLEKDDEKKVFITPNYKDPIINSNIISSPVYYADGYYISNDSDVDSFENLIEEHQKEFEDSSFLLKETSGNLNTYTNHHSSEIEKNPPLYKNTSNNYEEEGNEKRENNCWKEESSFRNSSKPCREEQLELRKLERGGYIWLVGDTDYAKKWNIEILYLFKNIIEHEENKSRKHLISFINNLDLEYFSLFNYSLSCPFLWLVLLLKHEKLQTICILDLCFSDLLKALVLLESYIKNHPYNFHGMMRRRRKRSQNLYYKFIHTDDKTFVDDLYEQIKKEKQNRKKIPYEKKKVLHIVVYTYHSKKKDKQFIKYLRKISRSLWRCNYLAHFSFHYYKYKYFNKHFYVDKLYRDYIMNSILSNYKLSTYFKKF